MLHGASYKIKEYAAVSCEVARHRPHTGTLISVSQKCLSLHYSSASHLPCQSVTEWYGAMVTTSASYLDPWFKSCQNTKYPRKFCGFPQSLKANARMMPQSFAHSV